MLDGRPKLIAKSLAEPALIALEPGLESLANQRRRERRLAVAGGRD
jgi:hypothetical protein